MAMDAPPNAILRLRSGERTQPGGPTRRRVRLRRHSPHTDMQTHTTRLHTKYHQRLFPQLTNPIPIATAYPLSHRAHCRIAPS